MKDILLVAHFCGDFDGKSNNRFNYLAKILSSHGFYVELVTSSFSHTSKKKREHSILENFDHRITLLNEPIYKKNISLKRVYSHSVLARNLKKYLNTRKKPDVIYCAVPSLSVAFIAAEYAKANGVKYIIDIQDLWPEAFRMVLNIPFLSDIIFYRMKKRADYIYKSADEIVAVSETYLNRALEVSTNVKCGHVVFLGTDLGSFDESLRNRAIIEKPDDEIWLAYAGTLGHSYDLFTVFDAIKLLEGRGYSNIKFIIMGDGPLKHRFESYSRKKGINTLFTGILPYDQMVCVLGICDMAINPISHGAAQSIINKHGDYAAAGLPILNTQESSEYRRLVEEYNMGLNCINNDAVDLSNKLLTLIRSPQLRIEMGENSRRLAIEKFDRRKTYGKICQLLGTEMDEYHYETCIN